MRRVEFYRHNLEREDIDRVVQVLGTLFLTTGETVHEFETRFAAYLGCERAVGVTSCTAALHLALLAYGVGPGNEVITTPMSFVATANAILHTGATPVFVDVEPETGNMNAELVEQAITSKTKAILPVHLYGQMCDMRRLREIADRFGLVIIEDAAHALEANRDGVRPGQVGEAACFSFYATKSLTSGEGGAVATNDPAVADRIKMLRLHGMDLSAADRYVKRYQHWDVTACGWKCNMSNVEAALLIGQLGRVDTYWRQREEIARRYEAAFADVEGLDFPKVLPSSKSGRHLFTILVPGAHRDDVLRHLEERGVGVAVNYRAIHLLTFYRQTFGYREGAFPIAEDIGRRTLSLPLYPKLTAEEQQYVIECLGQIMDALGHV